METSRAMPSSIDYTDVLPQAVPAVSRRRRFFPSNTSTFSEATTNTIRIDIESPNALLDAQHSYLDFEVFNLAGGAESFGADVGGAAIFFSSARLEQGGRVICDIQEFQRLHAGIIYPTQMSQDGKASESICGQNRAYNVGGAAITTQVGIAAVGPPKVEGAAFTVNNHNLNTNMAAGTRRRLTMPIPFGLFTQDKLIPLPLLKQGNPLTLVFTMGRAVDCGIWSALPGPGSLIISKVSYVASLVEVGRDVIEQFKMIRDDMGGQLAISGQDWEHNQGVLPAASTGDQPIRVPARKRSIKSLFWLANSGDMALAAGGSAIEDIYNMSFAGNANCSQYQLKVGGMTYPPQPVQCWGDVASAAPSLANSKRAECAMELAKAWGSLSYTSPLGSLNTLTYGTTGGDAAALAAGLTGIMATGDNGGAGPSTIAPEGGSVVSSCPFGLDLEAFQHTAIESGIDSQTLAQEVNLIITIDPAVNSGPEPKNVHIWTLYDQHYYFNADGMITFSN